MATLSIGDLAACAEAMAAIVALVISVWVYMQQRRIQEQQMKLNLLDRRYAVFVTVERFIVYVLQTGGAIALAGKEIRDFQFAVEQAKFLFGLEVPEYMAKVQEAATDLYVKVQEANQAESAGLEAQRNNEVVRLLGDISGSLLVKRGRVFGPYLQLS